MSLETKHDSSKRIWTSENAKTMNKLVRRSLKQNRYGVSPTFAPQCACHKARLKPGILKRKGYCPITPPFSPHLNPWKFFYSTWPEKRYKSRNTLGSAIYQYMIIVPLKVYEKCFKMVWYPGQGWVICDESNERKDQRFHVVNVGENN